MTPRVTGDGWTRTRDLVTVGTEETAARGHQAALAGTGEGAVQGRGSPLEKVGAPLVLTGVMHLKGVEVEEEAVVGVEEGEGTVPPVVVTTVALQTHPSALSPDLCAPRAGAES